MDILNWIAVYFVMFMVLSVLGYIAEVIDFSIENGKFIYSRGFLIGPYIPIYGVGALLMYFLLSKYKDDILVLFILSMVLCSLVEYLTSYVMEKMFKLRWWDYSDKKFNVNGRIFLFNSVLFGLAGILICSFLGPWIYDFITSWNQVFLYIVFGLLLVIFIVDFIVSNVIVTKLKHRAIEYSSADATSEIRERVAIELRKHSRLYSRVLKAFPDIFSLDNRFSAIKNLIDKAKKEIGNWKDKLRMMLL